MKKLFFSVAITLNIKALKGAGVALHPCRHTSLQVQLSLGLVQHGSHRSLKSVSEAGDTSGGGAVSSKSETSKELRIESFS